MAQELEKVAEEMGDSVRIVKVDTDEEPDLSTQLQIQGLPTLVYVGVGDKPALRTEGLLPAATIKEIITEVRLQPVCWTAAHDTTRSSWGRPTAAARS